MRLPQFAAAALWLLLCCQSGSYGQAGGGLGAATGNSTGESLREGGQLSGVQSVLPRGPIAGVEQVKPDTFVLPDGEGNLVEMPNWTFEAFMQAWKSMQEARQATEEPAYSLEWVECTGRVAGREFIRLVARVDVRLRDGHRTRIPLAFPNGILDGYQLSPQSDAAYVYYDENLGEHALWIAGDAGQTCRVELQILLPLVHRGTQTVLRFHAPRAASSTLTLDVPGAEVVADSPTNPTQMSTTTGGKETRIVARGLAETTEIAWRSLERTGAGDGRSLMAQSDVRVLAQQGLLTTEVNLSVRNLRGEVDRFRIRVPADHTLVSQEMEQATLHPVDPPQDAGDDRPEGGGEAASTIYEIRLAQAQPLPLAAKLVLERPITLEEEGSEVMLRGVEVLDAVGQEGRVTLMVSDDLRVRWDEGQRIRQVATPPDAVDAADITATFEVDSGDWRLPLTLAARRTEVSVAPDYQLDVGRDELRLTATFRYSVRGTIRQALRFALSGWELDEDPMGPESTIRRGSVYIDSSGTMHLSLADPAEGSFETTLQLRMPRPTSSNMLHVRLPECLIEGPVQEGRLAVRADPSLEVIPQSQSSLGLSSSPPPTPPAAPPAPLDDLAHELRVLSLPAEYVALVRQRTRTVSHQSRVTVEVYADRVNVVQEMHLDVRYLPANDLVLRAPAALVTNASASLALAGQSVAPPWDDFPLESGAYEGRIVLEQPLTGPTVLRIRYQVPTARDGIGGAASLQEMELPLAVPVADSHHVVATLSNHNSEWQAQFQSPRGQGANATPEPQPLTELNDHSHVELVAPVDALLVSFKPAATTSGSTLVVDRMWIQSRVTGNQIQTWSALRLVPTAEPIVLDLGHDASPEDLHIEVNERAIEAPTPIAGKVAIPTGELEQDTPCVIEIFQRAPFEVEVDGELRVVPPRVVNARAYTSVYWQLILPRSLHGFCNSDELVSESPWTFQGAYWARVPRISQSELENLLGLPHDLRPPASANQLLMAGLDLPLVLRATLVRRSSLVLLASGGILAAGIAILYVRRLQRWELIVAALAALAVAGMIYPAIAPLIAQAGMLGAALVLVSVFFKRLAGRWQATVSGSPSVDTSIFPRDVGVSESTPVHVPSSEAPSSARTLVHSLADSGSQHPA